MCNKYFALLLIPVHTVLIKFLKVWFTQTSSLYLRKYRYSIIKLATQIRNKTLFRWCHIKLWFAEIFMNYRIFVWKLKTYHSCYKLTVLQLIKWINIEYFVLLPNNEGELNISLYSLPTKESYERDLSSNGT